MGTNPQPSHYDAESWLPGAGHEPVPVRGPGEHLELKVVASQELNSFRLLTGRAVIFDEDSGWGCRCRGTKEFG